MSDRLPLDELKQRLADSAEALAYDVLGQPTSRTSRELRYGRNNSLIVNLRGSFAGQFRSWEEGVGGSMIDLIMHGHNCDYDTAVDLARGWIGDDPLPIRQAPKIDVDDEERKAAADAKRIWDEAIDVTGTPGDVYLRSRGIEPETWPNPIRWHRDGYLVFAVTDPSGRVHAVQRIWVNSDGTPKLKDGKKIKRSRGPRYGRTVILPGVPNGPICIAEGPETGLSVWYATGYETRISLGIHESVDMEQIPADREIILCRDDDPDKKNKRKNQKQKVQELRRTHTVKEVFPHHLRVGDKSDFNDVLTTYGKDALAERIKTVLVGPNKNANALPVEEAREKLDASSSKIGALLRQCN
jgi:phage/plasmid primase-like uncharacterized protein